MSFPYSLCYHYSHTDRQDAAVAETALIKTVHLWKVFWSFKLRPKIILSNNQLLYLWKADVRVGCVWCQSEIRNAWRSGQGEVRQTVFGRDCRPEERSYENPFVMHQILIHLLNPKASDVMIIAFFQDNFFFHKRTNKLKIIKALLKCQ